MQTSRSKEYKADEIQICPRLRFVNTLALLKSVLEVIEQDIPARCRHRYRRSQVVKRKRKKDGEREKTREPPGLC